MAFPYDSNRSRRRVIVAVQSIIALRYQRIPPGQIVPPLRGQHVGSIRQPKLEMREHRKNQDFRQRTGIAQFK